MAERRLPSRLLNAQIRRLQIGNDDHAFVLTLRTQAKRYGALAVLFWSSQPSHQIAGIDRFRLFPLPALAQSCRFLHPPGLSSGRRQARQTASAVQLRLLGTMFLVQYWIGSLVCFMSPSVNTLDCWRLVYLFVVLQTESGRPLWARASHKPSTHRSALV